MKAQAFVRIPCRSRADAKELALRLEADGYQAARRWKAVVARIQTRGEAEWLAQRLQGSVRTTRAERRLVEARSRLDSRYASAR